MKIAFITTVFNEQNTILGLLKSLNAQTMLPNETVIVDGGSADKTVEKILEFQKSKENRLKIKLIKAKGNRSIGRNKAIENAEAEIIAISDAGCVLDKNWLKEIAKPFEEEGVDVVAGYYKGIAKTSFQEALVPYVLVMNPKHNNFLPATRSMALRKKVWEELKGFDEKLSNNEDYAFAKKIKKSGYTIQFTKSAIVHWTPRPSIREAYNMFYRFALGDAESGIIRPKVVFIFARYLGGILLLIVAVLNHSIMILVAFLLLLSVYFFWSVAKNYRYLNHKGALVYLPLLQITSDTAVLMGTSKAFLN